MQKECISKKNQIMGNPNGINEKTLSEIYMRKLSPNMI